jgi:hypothetical protein
MLLDFIIDMQKQSIIEDGKVNWKAFLELQNKHEVGKPSQVNYIKAATELLKADFFSTEPLGNYTCSAGGGALLLSSVGPALYFTRKSDAEEYSALRWPQLEKEENVHKIEIRLPITDDGAAIHHTGGGSHSEM